MTCEEVKISLHDFVDELVDKKNKRIIEAHLRNCASCYEQYKNLTLFFGRLKDIADSIEPPKDIIENLSGELLKKSLSSQEKAKPLSIANRRKIKKEQKKQLKLLKLTRGAARKNRISRSILKYPSTRRSKSLKKKSGTKKTVLTLSPLGIMIAGYFVFQFLQINSPWKIMPLKGEYYINNSRSPSGKWNKGEALYTSAEAGVEVNVPSTGTMEIGDNTTLTLTKPNDLDNRISMQSGFVKMTTTTLLPKFSIDYGNYGIRDMGGVFSVNVDSTGNANVYVDFGLVEIHYNNKIYHLDEGYNCYLRPGNIPGTPIRFDASDSLKLLITEFDVKGGNDELIDKIAEQTTKSDALSILSLIPRCSAVKRQILFQKLANYFPPPATVTRMGIITLDADMLEDWWNEVEWQI